MPTAFSFLNKSKPKPLIVNKLEGSDESMVPHLGKHPFGRLPRRRTCFEIADHASCEPTALAAGLLFSTLDAFWPETNAYGSHFKTRAKQNRANEWRGGRRRTRQLIHQSSRPIP